MIGLIFDLDGTLLNTLEDLTDALNLALVQKGYEERSADEVKTLVGNGAGNLIARAVSETIPEEEKKEITQGILSVFREKYNELCLEKTRPYPGIPELLKELKSNGCHMAVVSNKQEDMTKKIIDHFFKGIFESVNGQRQGIPIKPDPSITNEVIDELALNTGEYFFIGDSGVDMQTAKNCGALAVGVTWGFRGVEELIQNGADFIIERPKELLKIVYRQS